MRGRLEEAQERLREETEVKRRAEEQCLQLQQQLNSSQEHNQTLQTTVTSLHSEVVVAC